MSFTENFGNPKGLPGRMMLVSMDREHLPMAKWAFEIVLFRKDIGKSFGEVFKALK